jgi:hypothetical protein
MQTGLIRELSAVKGARFASFTYESKETGEVSRYLLLLGVDLYRLYESDRLTLAEMLPSLDGLHRDAADALLRSIDESLAKGLGNNAAYTHGPQQGDTYLPVPGVPGMKLNKNDGTLHLSGLLQSKTVIVEGTPRKPVASKPLTLAKREIERTLRRGKIRQFALPNVHRAKLNGTVLELEA